tara:strand:- start:640 stop:1134 length:495 start_codon:yes stop_codon:yes gene_type:complete
MREKSFNRLQIADYCIISDSAIIEEGAVIGPYCEIGDGAHIKSGALLQGRNRIGPNCVVNDGVIMKNGSVLTNHTTLESNVFMGPNSIVLGDDLSRDGKRNTTIGNNTHVGAGSIVKAGVSVCENVTIGALTFVNKNITKSGTYVGIPVKRKSIALWSNDAFHK